MNETGQYNIAFERCCWVCNVCGKAFYKDDCPRCKRHPAASRFLGSNTLVKVDNLTLGEQQKVRKFLKNLRKK